MKTINLLACLCIAGCLIAPRRVVGQDSSANAGQSPSTAALVQANNRFALDLFRQVSPKPAENTFFSPYSISTALAMTWAGARGETAAQMAKAFHFAELPGADVTPGFASLQTALNQAQSASGSQLSVANSLWPEQNPENPFLPQYLQLVEKDFASTLTPVDFKSHADAAAAQINKWVADKTHDKIKNILKPDDLNADTRLALVNAIYFKGSWATPFSAQATRSQLFHTSDGSTKSVMLMRNVFLSYEAQYLDVTDGAVPCQVLSLNYFDHDNRGGGGRGQFNRGGNSTAGISMLIVLPRAPGDLGALEKNLTAEQIADWTAQMEGAPVEVFLPKFKIEQRFSLEDKLMALGAGSAFVNPAGHPPGDPASADFSGMNGAHDLFVSKVLHQAFVDVDEHGTEAAAATVVGLAGGGRQAQAPPPVFRADHPFLFFIRENATGSILFMGRLVNPSEVQTDASNTPSATPTTGGPRGGRIGGRGRNTAELALGGLQLDDATKAKAKPILDDELKKMLDLQADKTLTSDERAARNKSIKADTDAQLKLVLTDEQYARWKQISGPSLNNRPVSIFP